jgi:hypothetical protein
MVWVKGRSGNPAGRGVERPFAKALAEKIAEAGDDQTVLLEIADNLLRMARLQDGVTALPAIIALADRLDGKPAQESMVTVTKRDASDWTRQELVEFLQDAASLQQRELKVIEAKPVEEKS